MKVLKKITAILMIFSAFTIGGIACGGGGEEDTGQQVGETMEETGEEMGQTGEEMGETAGEAMEETGESAEDAAE